MRVCTPLLTISCLATLPITRATAETIQFQVQDITIHAEYYEPTEEDLPAAAVILLHRQQSERASCAKLAAALRSSGRAVLSLDLRGHGESSGPPTKNLAERAASGDTRLFKAMHRDVAGAMAWLAGRDDVDLSRVAIVGVAAGGAVALNYAARDRSIDGIIMIAPRVDDWGLDSMKDIDRLGTRSVLLVHADDKDRSACEALAAAAQQATLSSCPGGAETPVEQADCGPALADYLNGILGERSQDIVVASINGEVYHDADSTAARRIAQKNRRLFSNSEEAEARGLRASKHSRSQGGTDKG